jgi:hypothetical protein
MLLVGCASNLQRPTDLNSSLPPFYALNLEDDELTHPSDKNFSKRLDACLTPHGEKWKCLVMEADEFWKQQDYIIELEEEINGASFD